MTSKSLCFKLMREDLKRRMWTIALTVLGFVFTLLVPVALRSSAYLDRVREGWELRERERLIRQLVGMVGINGLVIAVLLAVAVVWAMSGFRYLHNSRQVDFYHSVPVKRHQLFLASYLNGILVPMVIYLLAQVLSVALVLRTGIGSEALGNTWWKMTLLNAVYYSMMYTTVVIAMMMTGNLIIALLGTVVFCGYGPGVVSLVMLYKAEWFHTYYETAQQIMAWKQAVNYSSPFANYMFAVADFSYNSLGAWRVTGAVFVTVALALLAYGLYRLRPSEAAGKAMTFKRTESPIKHLIALPVGVVFGMFFYGLRSTVTWTVFGVLCGVALTCCIMEIIYHFDFRKLFANWVHLAACFAISLLLVLAGMYDWYGYDSWLPDAGSVKSAAVVFRYDDGWVTYGDVRIGTDALGREMASWDYLSQDEYGLSHMELSDIYTVMELGKKGVEADKKSRSEGDTQRWTYGENCVVEYRLNNGKSAYRQYRIPYDELKPLKTAIHDSREYKKGLYPVLEQTGSDTERVFIQQYNQKKEVALKGDDMAHLLAVYQKELEELTMAAREKELPVGTIQFRTRSLEEGIALNEENRYGYNLEDRCFYPIYPSFVRTIEDLEKAGVTFVKLDETTVTDVRIRYYWDPEKIAGESGQAADGSGVLAVTWDKDSDEGCTAIYDDEKELARLIPALVFLDYRDMNCYYEMEMPANADTYVTVNVDIFSDHQDRERSSGRFGINMKLLSSEDTVRFKLAGQEETP